MRYIALFLLIVLAGVIVASPVRSSLAAKGTTYILKVSSDYIVEVEYIEAGRRDANNTTEWIDTEIKTDKDLVIDLVFTTNSGAGRDPFGDWHGSDSTSQRFFYNTLDLVRYDIGSRRITMNLNNNLTLDTPRHFRLSNFQVEDLTYGQSQSASSVLSFNGGENTFKICHTVNQTGTNYTRVYSVTLALKDDIVWDGVPVRFLNEQGIWEGAMYDTVSGQLFRNQGTGAFVIGPDKE